MSEQLGIAAYLRNLSVRSNRIGRQCVDPRTKYQIQDLCQELTDKAETIEELFRVPQDKK